MIKTPQERNWRKFNAVFDYVSFHQQEESKQMYFEIYWEKYKYKKIDDIRICIKLLETSVNLSVEISHTLIQQALWACNRFVKIDGILNQQTIDSINSASGSCLLSAFKAEIGSHYRNSMQNDHHQCLSNLKNVYKYLPYRELS